jgi:ubiquinone/menaquinone biosynthesis C-methylase UbiE
MAGHRDVDVMESNPYVDPFNEDVASNAGYIYTTNTRLSSRLATQRSTEILLEIAPFAGRSVLDVGCGDAFYTLQFWDRGRPRSLVGVDMAAKAVELANARKGARPISFEVGDAHALAYPSDSFDLVLIQSILHHDYDPLGIIREAFRLAPQIVIHEPNGSNPGLKVLERVSRYHREHGEKSYALGRITRWVEQAGGRVVAHKYVGFVPMFCPDPIARITKRAEYVVERMPFLNRIGCAVFALVAERGGVGPV